MAVSKERAMKMFNLDLERFMDEVRGLLVHYQIADWEAYVFFRKPDCPGSYVLKYEAVEGEFAERIVELHTKENTALREQLAQAKQLAETRSDLIAAKAAHVDELQSRLKQVEGERDDALSRLEQVDKTRTLMADALSSEASRRID